MNTSEIQVDPQHYIDTLAQQRNAAMDEIVKMAAIIRALEAQLKSKEEPADVQHDPQ